MAHLCVRIPMQLELRVAERAMQAGLLTEKDLAKADELQKLVSHYKIDLSLEQIILSRHAFTPKDMQQYLICKVQELEIPEIRTYLDPYAMKLFPTWKKQLDEVTPKLQNGEISAKCQKLKEEMKKMSLDLSLAHIALLQQEPSPNVWMNTAVTPVEEKGLLNLARFCERTRNAELLPPNAKLAKLCGSLLRMENIERVLAVQKELEKTYGLKIPAPHIFIETHKVEPYLLHALLLAQLEVNGEEVESWWGGLCLQKFKLPSGVIPLVVEVQQLFQIFLEDCHHLAWLEFPPEKEFALVEYFEKKLSAVMVKETRDIQHTLESADFSLSFLKILGFRQTVSAAELLEGVLSVLYKMPADNVAKIVASFKEVAQKQQKAALDLGAAAGQAQKPAAKFSKALTQTMPISRDHMDKKGKGTSSAANQLMERLKKSRESEEEVQKRAATAATLSRAVETPAETPKPATARQSMSVTLTDDLWRVREAIGKKMITESDVLESLLFQTDNEKGKTQSLCEILLEKNSLSRAQYSELETLTVKDNKVEVIQATREQDMKLTKLLMDYNMIQRERLPKILRIQSTLYSLGLGKSLDKILIDMKALSADMVAPLVAQCTRGTEEKKPAPVAAQPLHVEVKKEALSSERAMIAGLLAIPVVILLAGILVWQWLFPGATSPRRVTPPVITENPSTSVVATGPQATTTVTPKETGIPPVMSPVQRIDSRVDSMPKTEVIIKTPDIVPVALVLPKWRTLDVRYQDTETNARLTLEGELVFTALGEEPPVVQSSLQIWDFWKEKVYREGMLEVGKESFQSRFTLPKPLQPGRYYVRVVFPLQAQLPQVQKVLGHKQPEWWVPFAVGNAKDIEKHVLQNFKELEKRFAGVCRLAEDLQKVRTLPVAQLKSQWRSWSRGWSDRHKQLLEKCQSNQENYFIPMCEFLDAKLLAALTRLQNGYQNVEEWVQGFSLIPPAETPETGVRDFQESWPMACEEKKRLLLHVETFAQEKEK